jgi:hypothetical protein
MIPQLRLGEAQFEALRKPFLDQPDSAAAELPPLAELRHHWKTLNQRLTSLFENLTPPEWLERHSLVTDEEFAREPHRNRLAILLSRTNHASYHLGQLMLLKK